MARPTLPATSLINHLFGGSAYTQPTSWWISVYNADPGLGITGTTPSPLNTTRKQITGWTRSTNTATNTAQIVFDPVPVGQTWNVTHYAIFDASTAGNPICSGAFDVSKTISSGDVFTIGATRLSVAES
jgi:hypothetical protein